MSSAVGFDMLKVIGRLSANMDNIVRRRCKIGKVVEKARPVPRMTPSMISPFNPPQEWYPSCPPPVATWQVMDHPRNCVSAG